LTIFASSASSSFRAERVKVIVYSDMQLALFY
jgi:hypothetical protein